MSGFSQVKIIKAWDFLLEKKVAGKLERVSASNKKTSKVFKTLEV